MNIKKYTGRYYFKKKFWGGYYIYVEVVYTYYDILGDESPEYVRFIKASDEDLINFKLKLTY